MENTNWSKRDRRFGEAAKGSQGAIGTSTLIFVRIDDLGSEYEAGQTCLFKPPHSNLNDPGEWAAEKVLLRNAGEPLGSAHLR